MLTAGGCLEGKKVSGEPGDHQKGMLFLCLPKTPSSGLSLGLCESRAAAQPTFQLSMEERAGAVVRNPSQLFPWSARAKGTWVHDTTLACNLGNFLPFTVHCGLREVGN